MEKDEVKGHKDCLLFDRLAGRLVPEDVVLAEGFEGTVEYLSGMDLLDGSAERKNVIYVVKNIDGGGLNSIAKKSAPNYKGAARLVFADRTEQGAVTEVHAISKAYQL